MQKKLTCLVFQYKTHYGLTMVSLSLHYEITIILLWRSYVCRNPLVSFSYGSLLVVSTLSGGCLRGTYAFSYPRRASPAIAIGVTGVVIPLRRGGEGSPTSSRYE